MPYESVLWTPRTPITWDRLSQMNENTDSLKTTQDDQPSGLLTTSAASAPGTAAGQKAYQRITSAVSSNTSWAHLGTLRVNTPAGRLYRWVFSLPKVSNTANASVHIRMRIDSIGIFSYVFAHCNQSLIWSSIHGDLVFEGGGGTNDAFIVEIAPVFFVGVASAEMATTSPGIHYMEDIGAKS